MFILQSSGKLDLLYFSKFPKPLLCWINFPCSFEVPCNEVSCKLSVIWKKGQSQNGVTRKQSTPNYPKTQTFLTTWYVHARMRIRELKNLFVFFSENLICFVFLLSALLDSPFCLIAYDFFMLLTISNIF